MVSGIVSQMKLLQSGEWQAMIYTVKSALANMWQKKKKLWAGRLIKYLTNCVMGFDQPQWAEDLLTNSQPSLQRQELKKQ